MAPITTDIVDRSMRMISSAPITAIIYPEGQRVDHVMRRIAQHLIADGRSVAGFIEIRRPREDRTRCDMILQEIASGERVIISEDRGSDARGCMLNVQELARAETLATRALENRPDLLIINKFGKTEAEGRGFRCLMVIAIDQAIPILIAVPARNLDPWQQFSATLSNNVPVETLASDMNDLCTQLGFSGNDPNRSVAPLETSVSRTR